MHIVAFTGAGISAESGLSTFRGQGGLWENQPVHKVASPEAFKQDPAMVMRFYNARRKQLLQVEPNPGHHALAQMETFAKVKVVTQNVDDLHERAGSSQVLHLHGELLKVRAIDAPKVIYPWTQDLQVGQTDPEGRLLRPHIVWFGEAVTEMPKALEWVQEADVLIVCGTSLQVYPAAGLLYETKPGAKIYYIDPDPGYMHPNRGVETRTVTASFGLPKLKVELENLCR